MAYDIINNFIPPALYPLKAPYNMKPESITIHNTWNDATAINEINYMHRNKAATSYHVAVDDKHAVQAIPFSRNAWHAGDGGQGKGNRSSIGVEICYSKSGGPKYKAAEANAIEYIAHVLHQYGWGIDRVKWHRDWSGKNCPHRIFAEGRADQVRKAIADRLKELNAPSTVEPKPVTPVSKPKEEVKVAEKKNDIPKWAEKAWAHVEKEGYIKDGRPNDNVTRAELAMILARRDGIDV